MVANEHLSSGEDRFKEIVKRMPINLQKLQDCPFIKMCTDRERRELRQSLLSSANITKVIYNKNGSKTAPGNYVLYKNCEPMYTGRTDQLPDRILEHGTRGGSETAAFAFLLAREKWQKRYPNDDSTRNKLATHPKFRTLFDTEIEEVKKDVCKSRRY